MKKKKRVCCILCALMVFFIVPSGIYASSDAAVKQEYSSISPRWTGVAQVEPKLFVSGETVNPYIVVKVDTDKVTKVTFVGELQKKVNGQWTTIKTWDVSKRVTSINVKFDESYKMQTGFEYTYVTTVKAYNGTKLLDTINVEGPVKSL
ncbi:hypothetical protein [Bacilliculturomica massiliensis]|uniref:hypothetical protein n=1 Tax=Bacilliculturomica massiliensis TaxID=1917867 RepID=UPI0010315F25|nr:hypothetical protein [Bacilliculturomica massiliensis]